MFFTPSTEGEVSHATNIRVPSSLMCMDPVQVTLGKKKDIRWVRKWKEQNNNEKGK